MVLKANRKKFVNSDIIKIPESPISELARKAQSFKDAISLGRGEPDFNMADFMKEAMVRALKENQTHYAAAGSIPGLNEAIAEKLRKENGIHVDPELGIVVGVGSSAILQAVFGTLFEPNEEIILMDPTYLMYISLVQSMHIKPSFVPVYEKNNFAPAVDELEKACTKKTKALLINSPCNPTGGVFTKKELEEIAQFAIDKDIIIITDEIYENVIYDGAKHYSIASFDNDIAARTITVNGFSKSFAMTGLRVGYAAGPTELMKHVFKYNYFGHICTCVPAMYAALEGLRNPKTKKFIADQVSEYDRRRKFIVKRLNEIGLETKMPHGAFYTFSRCDRFDKKSYSFSNRVLEKTHVITTPGSAFGPHGEGFVRFSYATKYEQIEEAMERIEKMLRK